MKRNFTEQEALSAALSQYPQDLEPDDKHPRPPPRPHFLYALFGKAAYYEEASRLQQGGHTGICAPGHMLAVSMQQDSASPDTHASPPCKSHLVTSIPSPPAPFQFPLLPLPIPHVPT